MSLTNSTNGFHNLSRFLQRNAKNHAKLLHRCAERYVSMSKIVFFAWLIIASVKAAACTCVFAFNHPDSFENKFNEADYIALVDVGGMIVNEEQSFRIISVVDLWKGGSDIRILKNAYDDCSETLREGTYYLFAVKRDEQGVIEPQTCSYTLKKSWFSRESRFVKKSLKKRNKALHSTPALSLLRE